MTIKLDASRYRAAHIKASYHIAESRRQQDRAMNQHTTNVKHAQDSFSSFDIELTSPELLPPLKPAVEGRFDTRDSKYLAVAAKAAKEHHSNLQKHPDLAGKVTVLNVLQLNSHGARPGVVQKAGRLQDRCKAIQDHLLSGALSGAFLAMHPQIPSAIRTRDQDSMGDTLDVVDMLDSVDSDSESVEPTSVSAQASNPRKTRLHLQRIETLY